jgi:hypothetical protein
MTRMAQLILQVEVVGVVERLRQLEQQNQSHWAWRLVLGIPAVVASLAEVWAKNCEYPPLDSK